MTIPLSEATLREIPPAAAVPGYDRGALKPGILHIGVGNFHRAHQAVYLDRLFATGADHDWALVGASVRAEDAPLRDALAAQDFLTTVVEQSAEESRARVIGGMVEFLAPGDAGAIVSRLRDPAIRIVSLTITEGGYFLDSGGRFDATRAEIAADAADPEAPKTVFGVLVAALKARRDAGEPPFTVMSCDNVPHNGRVAHAAVTGLAALIDADLAGWIDAHVAFPNGMVDRITPATGERERADVESSFGVADARPVYCESFSQWVLEDDFPAGRPALERVGVEFVEDVTPYELMKIRILNGGHAAIAYPAGLLDIRFAHEAMAHPLVSGFLRKIETEEILPTVPPVPNTDTRAYLELIEERFANPKIGDTVRRLCLDGSNRQPKFIVPSIADRLASGAGVTGLALESALWCRYCYGETESGAAIEPNDPNWRRLIAVAAAARRDPAAWLAQQDVYGATGADPVFGAHFAESLGAVWAEGVEAALTRYLADDL